MILTESDLRSALLPRGCREYRVAAGTFVTPLAREYLRDRGIELKQTDNDGEKTMVVTPLPDRGEWTYVDAATGQGYAEKPESMTHLRGNLLVHKNSPRIAFRGKLDSLEADIICVQAAALKAGMPELSGELGEALAYTRRILAAEVRDVPLESQTLFGMDADRLRYVSQHVLETMGTEHIVPSAELGEIAALLNRLRTQVRECELSAVRAFSGDSKEREDIVQSLNRLSSGVYILLCRLVVGNRGGQNE